MFSVDGYVF